MDKSTDQLLNEITTGIDIDNFLEHNFTNFYDNPFLTYLLELIEVTNIKKSDLIVTAEINKQYLYELLANKRKKPSRDVVLKLCIALNLDLEQCNTLLKKASHGSLYPRVTRDSVILYCLLNKMNLIETNILLLEKEQDLLK